MQTIENSVLRVAVDEKGGQVLNLVNQNNQIDYLRDQDTRKNLEVAFKGADRSENWAQLLPWTVIDKGDAQVSLALIDDNDSYQKFPYHFEAILTYLLEGNRVELKCYLKNNSHKDMPFSFAFTLPVFAGWSITERVNELELTRDEITLKAEATNFELLAQNEQIIAANDSTLKSDASVEFKLALTVS
ncbi:aldose epimerase [Lactobacillus xylocopicola]|uniref:Aldose 1-epimerase n=1 Tax=Lactobacillus xylocopicola TaxID=2976676 RepID=A0ABM8BIU8_9LACO|nr:aldose epimerase [Lactobacillus xylocopicola]BDR61034.1 aldose 1-epimerase [Lactobacillus xylocopicola]